MGRRRKISIEKLGDALAILSRGGGSEVNRGFGIRGGADHCRRFVRRVEAEEEQLGGAQRLEGFGQRKVFVEQQADRQKSRTSIAADGGEQVGSGRIENKSGNFGMKDGQVGSQRGSDAGAVRNDLLCGNGAQGREIFPGGIGVLHHFLLVGMSVSALAVASVIEGEDIEAESVKSREGRDGIDEGAVAGW